jgi:hypothetical protein
MKRVTDNRSNKVYLFPDELSNEEITERINRDYASIAPELEARGRDAMLRGSMAGLAGAGMAPGPVAGLGAMVSNAMGEPNFGQSMLNQTANVARISVPIAAGALAAPVVGTGLAGAAAIAAVGGLSSAISEFLGQTIEQASNEDTKYSGRQIAGAAVGGSVPIIGKGGMFLRPSFNVAAQTAGSELSRFISSGQNWEEYKDDGFKSKGGLDTTMRVAAPLLGGVAAGTASRVGQLSDEAKANIAVIRNNGYTGPASLSMGLPEMAGAEREAFARNSRRALQVVGDIEASLDDAIPAAFPDVPNTSGLQDYLIQTTDKLKNLQSDYRTAKAAADRATMIAEEARRTNQTAAPALIADAKLKAMEVTARRAMFNNAADTFFGGNKITSIDDVTSVRRGTQLMDLARSSDDFVSSVVSAAYDSAGINNNYTVLTRADFEREVANLAKSSRNAVQGKLARQDVLDMAGAFFDARAPKGRLSYEGFKEFKNKVYNDFVASGKSPRDAERITRDAYRALINASESYLNRVDPTAVPRLRAANALASSRFSAIDTPVYQMLENGQSDLITNLLLDEIPDAAKQLGGRPVMDQVDAIASMIAASADPANPSSVNAATMAGDLFKRGFFDNVRDSVFRRSQVAGGGQRLNHEAFDPAKIVQDLDKLSATGFPVHELGLGTAKQVRALARLGALTQVPAVSKQEYETFLNQAVELGADTAAWRVEYGRAVRDQLLSTTAKARRANNARVFEARRNAKIDERVANDALVAAQKDPLVVFLNDQGVKLSSDPGNNAKWIEKLLTVAPDTLTDFTGALQASGRTADLDNLRRAAAATVMREFYPASKGVTPQVNMKKLTDFFNSKGGENEMKRKAFQAIMGAAEFDNLKRLYGEYTKIAVDSITDIKSGATEPVQRGINVRNRLTPNKGVTAYVNPTELMRMMENGMYNMAYTMYIDPRYAPKFKAAASNTNATISPALQAILTISRMEDERTEPMFKPPR